jgi:hypothetical protein
MPPPGLTSARRMRAAAAAGRRARRAIPPFASSERRGARRAPRCRSRGRRAARDRTGRRARRGSQLRWHRRREQRTTSVDSRPSPRAARIESARCSCRSTATQLAPHHADERCAMCVVLPPGAAHMSRIRSPGCGSSACATTCCDATDCGDDLATRHALDHRARSAWSTTSSVARLLAGSCTDDRGTRPRWARSWAASASMPSSSVPARTRAARATSASTGSSQGRRRRSGRAASRIAWPSTCARRRIALVNATARSPTTPRTSSTAWSTAACALVLPRRSPSASSGLLQVQQLVRADAQRVQHRRVELVQRALAERGDHVVEPACLLHRAVCRARCAKARSRGSSSSPSCSTTPANARSVHASSSNVRRSVEPCGPARACDLRRSASGVAGPRALRRQRAHVDSCSGSDASRRRARRPRSQSPRVHAALAGWLQLEHLERSVGGADQHPLWSCQITPGRPATRERRCRCHGRAPDARGAVRPRCSHAPTCGLSARTWSCRARAVRVGSSIGGRWQ